MGLSLSKAWDESSAFLGRESRLIVPIALATFGLPAAVSGWVNPAESNGGGATVILALLLLFLGLVGQLTIIRLALGYRDRIGDALRDAAGRVPALIGALLLFIFPLALAGTLLISILLVAAGQADAITTMKPEEIFKLPAVGLGLLVVIMMAFFFAIRLFPMSSVAAAESGGAIQVIRRSWRLTRGHFGRLMILFALVSIAGLTLDGAVKTVIGAISRMALGDATPFSLPALIVGLASGAVASVVSAVSATLSGRVYAQLSNFGREASDNVR